MPAEDTQPRNWFDRGGEAYARFRPDYPAALAEFLGSISGNRNLAVDVGCGSGQLTTQLADQFEQVIGLDPSADQLAQAKADARILYRCSPAEEMAAPDQRANLVSAAQAAHWFDLPRFYREVRRVCMPDGVLALVSYGMLRLEGALDERFVRFHGQEIGPYWPKERQWVDSGYAGLPFPFDELPTPSLEIRKVWTLEDLLGYISTWSAVRRAREACQEKVLGEFAADLSGLWGNPLQPREVRWPIRLRVGRV